MAHYIVTGCAGFIGARVTALLLEDGHRVAGIDNLNDAYDVRLKHWRLEQIQNHPNFSFCRLDICDRNGLHDVFLRKAMRTVPFDGVINLAARAGVRPSVEDPWVYFETNTIGAMNLLEACREFGVKKFVLASSSSLYGNNPSLPWREEMDTNQPISPYAASKKAAETLCYTYHYLHGIDVTVFRYFTVYGPAGRPDMMPFRLVQWINEGRPVTVYGDGTQSRDFTYVDDIARGTVAGLKPLGYEIINLGSDQSTVLIEALRKIEGLLGRSARIDYQPAHRSDVLATWADIGKAERLLGWRPQMTIDVGLERLVAWYRANQLWVQNVATT